MKNNSKNNTHGGARLGAGRPTTGRKTVAKQVSLTPELWTFVDAQRGARNRSEYFSDLLSEKNTSDKDLFYTLERIENGKVFYLSVEGWTTALDSIDKEFASMSDALKYCNLADVQVTTKQRLGSNDVLVLS